jgi:flagellar biosynthetic protein FlhB
MAGAGGEKTEKATARKREKSREEGQVANSREAASVAVMMTTLLVFYFGAGWMLEKVRAFMLSTFLMIENFDMTVGSLYLLMRLAIVETMTIIAPLLLALLVAGVGINLVQVGWHPSTKTMEPKLSKLNPISGAKKLVSLKSLVELVKSCLKISLISYIAFRVVRDSFDQLISMGVTSIHSIIDLTGTIAMDIIWNVTIALILLAILDIAYQRYDNEKKMKMTKQEVKEENKNYEGNPQVKSRQRGLQRDIAMRRMMDAVPDADVILTNPTHVSVAIKYDALVSDAPMVVAKGAGVIALRIREIATENGVPILERPPLARELYRTVKLGSTVPKALYEAVAQILAFIYNLKSEKGDR